jgi:ABC-2 type transport system permease protein
VTRLLIFLKNELRLIARDKRALLLLFLMPALLVFILSSILNHLYLNQRPQMRILVSSLHNSTVGEELIASLKESGQNVDFSSEIPQEPYKKYDVLIKIPDNLPELLRIKADGASGEKIEFVFYKFLDPFQKKFLMNEFVHILQSQIIGEINKELKNQKAGLTLLADPSALIVESREHGARDFSPLSFSLSAWSLFAIFFIVVPFSNSFFRDWNNDILLRLKSMGISKANILGGRMLAYLLVNFLQFFFLLSLGLFVFPHLLQFSLEFRASSLLPMLFVVFFCSLTATTYALFISCIARTQEQASALGAFGVVILSLMGGVMVPSIFMPPFMLKFIAVLSPLYWGLDAFAEAFQATVDWSGLGTSLLILLAFAAMFFGISLKLFNWEKET